MESPLIHVQHLHVHLPAAPSVGPVDLGKLDLSSARAANAVRPRFELSADGTCVTDHSTGLMWPVYESEKSMNYDAAEKYAAELRLGDFSDWTLPTREQRLTITDLSRYNPALFDPLKHRDGHWEWTCTPCAWLIENNTPRAFWQVCSNDGLVSCDGRDSYDGFFRPCRVVGRPGQ